MTSKLTREQLHERARENVKALKMASRQTAFESAREEILADLQLAELALAAMDSEPVAEVLSNRLGNDTSTIDRALPVGTKLYRHAQPAPEYPEVLPCPVLLEPGLRFGKGIKTSTMLAALARRAVHESDMAALSPEERVEFQARIEEFKALIAQPAPAVPEEITIETATIIAYGLPTTNIGAIFKAGHDACRVARLKAQPQNAPQNIPEIIPDGWIPVSEHLPKEKGVYQVWNGKYVDNVPFWFGSFQSLHSELITHWMPLPAAPQEVKP